MAGIMTSLGQKQRDRLAYIEFRLWFLGDACRRDLMTRFGIAPAVATRDFTLYRELAPQNIDFDGRRKLYIPGNAFTPLFGHAPDKVLTAISQGFGEGDDRSDHGYLPCELPLRLNRPSLSELSIVTRAIHQQQVLRLQYHSLKRGLAVRDVIPHALVDSGLRWHVRVFDRVSGEFRDLVISRIESARHLPGDPILEHEQPASDLEWNQRIDLLLAIHPNIERPEIVRRDFGLQGSQLALTVRAAIAGYVLQRWNVDCSEDHRLDPLIHRLYLKNLHTLQGVKSIKIAPGYDLDTRDLDTRDLDARG